MYSFINITFIHAYCIVRCDINPICGMCDVNHAVSKQDETVLGWAQRKTIGSQNRWT